MSLVSPLPTHSFIVQDPVLYEADLTIPAHPDLHRLCASQEFLAFMERIQRELQKSNCDCLSPAREHFDVFLGSHGVLRVLHAFLKRKGSSAAAPPGAVGQAPTSVSTAAMPQPNQFAPEVDTSSGTAIFTVVLIHSRMRSHISRAGCCPRPWVSLLFASDHYFD